MYCAFVRGKKKEIEFSGPTTISQGHLRQASDSQGKTARNKGVVIKTSNGIIPPPRSTDVIDTTQSRETCDVKPLPSGDYCRALKLLDIRRHYAQQYLFYTTDVYFNFN